MPLFFWFDLFLEARVEILEKIMLDWNLLTFNYVSNRKDKNPALEIVYIYVLTFKVGTDRRHVT